MLWGNMRSSVFASIRTTSARFEIPDLRLASLRLKERR